MKPHVSSQQIGEWTVEADLWPSGLLSLRFLQNGSLVATAEIEGSTAIGWQSRRRGASLVIDAGVAGRRMLAFVASPDGLIVIERAQAVGEWSIDLAGQRRFTHDQLRLRELKSDETVRIGAFSQHGQLFDLRDWILAESEGRCAALLSLRPGRWRAAPLQVLRADRETAGVPLKVRDTGVTRRTFLLASVSAETALAERKPQFAIPGWQHDFVPWAAGVIARQGFARPERTSRQSLTIRRPDECVFGENESLQLAISAARANPGLAAGQSFWHGDYPAAAACTLTTLRTYVAGLQEGGYLHPIGNPVAARVLGPAVAVFHWLDCLGHLSDEQRQEGAQHIATLADLLMRSDFYPYHIATRPPEFPYGPDSMYRGMLNQNFNTDRYVFVGLAGCVLADHPRSRAWRRGVCSAFSAVAAHRRVSRCLPPRARAEGPQRSAQFARAGAEPDGL